MTETALIQPLTTPQACAWLKIGKTKLYELLKEGRVHRVKLGSRSSRWLIGDLRPNHSTTA